jgi:hypothetical protein
VKFADAPRGGQAGNGAGFKGRDGKGRNIKPARDGVRSAVTALAKPAINREGVELEAEKSERKAVELAISLPEGNRRGGASPNEIGDLRREGGELVFECHAVFIYARVGRSRKATVEPAGFPPQPAAGDSITNRDFWQIRFETGRPGET